MHRRDVCTCQIIRDMHKRYTPIQKCACSSSISPILLKSVYDMHKYALWPCHSVREMHTNDFVWCAWNTTTTSKHMKQCTFRSCMCPLPHFFNSSIPNPPCLLLVRVFCSIDAWHAGKIHARVALCLTFMCVRSMPMSRYPWHVSARSTPFLHYE